MSRNTTKPRQIKRMFKTFLSDDDGAVTVDFVIMAAGIAILALVVATVIVREGLLHGTMIADLVASALRS